LDARARIVSQVVLLEYRPKRVTAVTQREYFGSSRLRSADAILTVRSDSSRQRPHYLVSLYPEGNGGKGGRQAAPLFVSLDGSSCDGESTGSASITVLTDRGSLGPANVLNGRARNVRACHHNKPTAEKRRSDQTFVRIWIAASRHCLRGLGNQARMCDLDSFTGSCPKGRLPWRR
jgi:hypothetical protein